MQDRPEQPAPPRAPIPVCSRFLGQDEGVLHELVQGSFGGHCVVHVGGCEGVILFVAYHRGGQRVEAQEVSDDASCSRARRKQRLCCLSSSSVFCRSSAALRAAGRSQQQCSIIAPVKHVLPSVEPHRTQKVALSGRKASRSGSTAAESTPQPAGSSTAPCAEFRATSTTNQPYLRFHLQVKQPLGSH